MVRKEVKRDVTKEYLQFKCKSIIKALKYYDYDNPSPDNNKRNFGFKIIAKLLIILNKEYSLTEKQYKIIEIIIKRLSEYLIEK